MVAITGRVAAYMWLSLAAAQGRAWADRQRRRIGKDMSQADFRPIARAD